MESWKKVEGYEAYEVSDWGRVRRGENVLKGYLESRGYLRVNLYNGGVCKKNLIHRLVGIAFLPNPEGKLTINHIDHDKANNLLANLEWATYSEQTLHSPIPIGKSGHRCINQIPSGSYRVRIMRNSRYVFQKSFPTLQEAITARDAFLNQS